MSSTIENKEEATEGAPSAHQMMTEYGQSVHRVYDGGLPPVVSDDMIKQKDRRNLVRVHSRSVAEAALRIAHHMKVGGVCDRMFVASLIGVANTLRKTAPAAVAGFEQPAERIEDKMFEEVIEQADRLAHMKC